MEYSDIIAALKHLGFTEIIHEEKTIDLVLRLNLLLEGNNGASYYIIWGGNKA